MNFRILFLTFVLVSIFTSCDNEDKLQPVSEEKLSIKNVEVVSQDDLLFQEAIKAFSKTGISLSNDSQSAEVWTYSDGRKVLAYSDVDLSEVSSQPEKGQILGNVYHYDASTGSVFSNSLIAYENVFFKESDNLEKIDWFACGWFAIAVAVPDPAGVIDVYFGWKCIQSWD